MEDLRANSSDPGFSAFRIRDMPNTERPRERLLSSGADALRNAELIAILLRTGLKGVSALQVAEQLLVKFGTLQGLAVASVDELRSVRGVGKDKAVALKGAFTLAKRLANEFQREAPLLDTPERVANLLREENRSYLVERFQVLLLNTRRRLIRIEHIGQGTLDSVLVHPRDVFRCAIAANASSIVLVHNHPSGDPMPSEPDIRMTRDLIRSGQLLKIEVADHIILGKRTAEQPKDYISMRDLGYFHP